MAPLKCQSCGALDPNHICPNEDTRILPAIAEPKGSEANAWRERALRAEQGFLELRAAMREAMTSLGTGKECHLCTCESCKAEIENAHKVIRKALEK